MDRIISPDIINAPVGVHWQSAASLKCVMQSPVSTVFKLDGFPSQETWRGVLNQQKWFESYFEWNNPYRGEIRPYIAQGARNSKGYRDFPLGDYCGKQFLCMTPNLLAPEASALACTVGGAIFITNQGATTQDMAELKSSALPSQV